MFGLKWLWKTNRGSNIDTSNFVSKEFLNTTLQDYVNRDLLNTTLSNELANYVSITSLNNTLNNYVLNTSLNTTLSSYVQTDTLNTTLQNYVQTTTLNNYVSTNTAQTITGAKTFSNQVVINNTPEPLVIKATNTNKSYILFKTPQNTSTLSIGSNATGANIDINAGDLTIHTQQANKTITLDTGRVKLNRSALDLGTIINAGYGGNEVKFIPENNSTKTLKFYENNQSDTRKFNLLVPEPTANNNPATKQYVDNAIAGVSNANLENQINELNTFKTGVENSYGYNIRYQDIQLQDNSWLSTGTIGEYTVYQTAIDTISDVKFLSASPHFNGINSYQALRTMFTALPRIGTRVYLNFQCYGGSNGTPTFDNSYVRVFYIDNISTRTQNPYYIVEEDN